MSKYEAVYFVGDNQAINRVRVDSSKTRNRGAFSGLLAALVKTRVGVKVIQNSHYCYISALFQLKSTNRQVFFTERVDMYAIYITRKISFIF